MWKGFIMGVGDMIFSYSIGIWYFTRRNKDMNIPIKRTCFKIFRHHLGTIVYHTVVNSFLWPFKWIFYYFYITMKNAK